MTILMMRRNYKASSTKKKYFLKIFFVKVDIDTDNGDAVDNIKDEDDHENENDDNIDDVEEGQSFINKEKYIFKRYSLPPSECFMI